MLESSRPKEPNSTTPILISKTLVSLRKKQGKSVSFADASEEIFVLRSMTPLFSDMPLMSIEKSFESKLELDQTSETNKDCYNIIESQGNEHNFPAKHPEIINASTAKSTFVEYFKEIGENLQEGHNDHARLEKEERGNTCSRLGCGCKVF